MSLVDWGKSLHLRLTEKMCPRRIVFHHVPKCGGTSVGRALRRAYILSQGTVTPEQSQAAFSAVKNSAERDSTLGDVLELREMMLLYLLYSDIRCVSAHIPFSDVAHEKFQGKYQFVSLLRDPVDRFVSHYMWSHRRPAAHGHIKEEFEDFLSSERAAMMGATYVRYFCGRPHLANVNLNTSVETAIRNLRRLDHVGFLDDMPAFEASLQKLTAKKLKIGHENVGRTRSVRQSILDGRLRQQVLDVCAPDREIWAAVQDLRAGSPVQAVRPEHVHAWQPPAVQPTPERDGKRTAKAGQTADAGHG
jgi:hypothetical protein